MRIPPSAPVAHGDGLSCGLERSMGVAARLSWPCTCMRDFCELRARMELDVEELEPVGGSPDLACGCVAPHVAPWR